MTALSPVRELTLGALLSLTLKVLALRPVTTGLLFFLFLYLPTLSVAYIWPEPMDAEFWSAELWIWFGLSTLPMIPAAVFFGWLALVAERDLNGPSASSTSLLVFALERIVPLALVTAVVFVVTLLGLVLLIVPGITWSLATVVSTPAMVVERLGPIDAIRRSIFLTRARLSMILVYSLALFVPVVIATFVAEYLVAGSLLAGSESNLFAFGFRPVSDSAFTALSAAFSAALYRELVALRPTVSGE